MSGDTVGLDPRPIDRALGRLERWTQPSGTRKPMFAGAVATLGHDGSVVRQFHTGMALRYADGTGTELPVDQQIPMREGTIFDLASVSKLYTSIAIMQQVEAGRVDLDDPVVASVPEFGEHGKQHVRVRQLLTHTSGLPGTLPLWRDYPDKTSRLHAALTVEPVTRPGSTYTYSDLNFIALGVLLERVTGTPLQNLVADGITRPLGMTDTQYNPPKRLRGRIAATEYQEGGATADRGLVWGEVHDENAWSLDGVAGHAGVFSTARDMSILAQALLNGGTYRGHRILAPDSVEQIITNDNRQFPGDDHGLGFERNQRRYMSGLAGPHTAGHTGFTGTSIVLDYPSRSFAILLSNRVHPSRRWGTNNPARQALAQALADALPVRRQRPQ